MDAGYCGSPPGALLAAHLARPSARREGGAGGRVLGLLVARAPSMPSPGGWWFVSEFPAAAVNKGQGSDGGDWLS